MWSDVVNAIIAVESGGDSTKVGDNGRAVGILQIHEEVIIDVNSVYGTRYVWPDDAYNPQASKDIFYKYIAYWGPYTQGRMPTPEEAARIWNGGPNGHEKRSTELYWNKVRVNIPNEKTVQE